MPSLSLPGRSRSGPPAAAAGDRGAPARLPRPSRSGSSPADPSGRLAPAGVDGAGRPSPTAPTGHPIGATLLDEVPVAALVGLGATACASVGLAGVLGGVALAAAVAAALIAGAFATVERCRSVRLRRSLAAARRQAHRDSVTGALNRAGIVADIEARLRDRKANEVVGVLFLDVDRLRLINHSIGHRGGDEVLRAIAHRISSVLRPHDAVGRLGAELVVAASGVRAVSDLERLAERIIGVLSAPVRLSDGSRQAVDVSIGLAYALKPPACAEDLLHDADTAMHHAKAAGASCSVTFDADLRARVEARIELERQLRRAVTDGELVVQYQPIVATATGTAHVVEALVRWRHPTRGLLPPGQFLSVASESGAIIELGRHVLTTACHQAVQWSAATARPVGVAVNLAERQLFDRGLVAMVAEALAASGLPADQLQLEVSEELLGEHADAAIDVLRRLSALGVRLALDDFGANQASLRRLRDLDVVRTIKLDGSFVTGVADDPVDRTVVAAVVALARSLDMDVVAEGVETPTQATALAQLGVDHLQGFLLQRPGEAGEVTAWLLEPSPSARTTDAATARPGQPGPAAPSSTARPGQLPPPLPASPERSTPPVPPAPSVPGVG